MQIKEKKWGNWKEKKKETKGGLVLSTFSRSTGSRRGRGGGGGGPGGPLGGGGSGLPPCRFGASLISSLFSPCGA